MTSLRDFLEAIDFKITDGSEYCWECYGPNARYLDSHGPNLNQDYSIHCIFDSKDQTVYAIEAWDYRNNREYRWMDPDYVDAYREEAELKDVDPDESMDGQRYINLEVPEDILEKVSKIVAGEEYDTRVDVPLVLPDDQIFELMKLAHERDITLNQLVEEVLLTAIEAHQFDDLVERKPVAKMKGKKKKDK